MRCISQACGSLSAERGAPWQQNRSPNLADSVLYIPQPSATEISIQGFVIGTYIIVLVMDGIGAPTITIAVIINSGIGSTISVLLFLLLWLPITPRIG